MKHPPPDPHDNNRPLGIDLFSGVGGLSLGFEQAGFDIAAAVEVDPIHAAAHAFNFPQCAVLAESIANLTGGGIREKADLGRRTVDVVFGGAPCQGFSLIGQRSLDDERNQLVKDFVRIVDELDANYFVFENVKGLTVGRQKQFLDELLNEFRSIDYELRLPWRVLNVADYGVPQNRERLILIGAKRGMPLPEYPQPTTHYRRATIDDLLLHPTPTCREALADLPDAENFEPLLDSDFVVTDRWGEPGAYAAKMRCQDASGWGLGYHREWDPSALTASARTAHTGISRRRFRETTPGNVEPISRFFKLAPDGISNTLRAGTDSARGAFTSPRPIHYKYARCITVREMARLHGFPDWFRFHVTKWHGARQIGNAVPPPLARAIASKIADAVALELKTPETVLPLGDPRLLEMDMSEAAEFWGVPVTIGRRTFKSGLRKRKQADIEADRAAAEKTKVYA